MINGRIKELRKQSKKQRKRGDRKKKKLKSEHVGPIVYNGVIKV
jgi:hypothetical protein